MQKTSNQTLEASFKIIQQKIYNTWSDIVGSWDRIGYNQQQLEDRCNIVEKYIRDMMDDLKFTEDTISKDITETLNGYKKNVKQLEEELNVASRSEQANALLLKEIERYKKTFLELTNLKQERAKRLNELTARQDELVRILNENSYSFSSSNHIDQNEISNFEKHIERLEKIKASRMSRLKSICQELEKLINTYKLKMDANSPLNRLLDVFADQKNAKLATKIELSEQSMTKYAESLEQLKQKCNRLGEDINDLKGEIKFYWEKYDLYNAKLANIIDRSDFVPNEIIFMTLMDELDRCHKARLSKLCQHVDTIRHQIRTLWDQLHYGDSDKQEFIDYMNEDQSIDEDLLCRHETYFKNLNEIMSRRMFLTEKFQKWCSLWSMFTDFDLKYSNPGRFTEKGYSALFEQKERHRFENELAKLEKELKVDCESYAQNEKREFRIDGVKLIDYIESCKFNFNQMKKDNRKERQAIKVSESEKKSSTPFKQTKTPTKPSPTVNQMKMSKLAKSAEVKSTATQRTTSVPAKKIVVKTENSPKTATPSNIVSEKSYRASIKNMTGKFKRRSSRLDNEMNPSKCANNCIELAMGMLNIPAIKITNETGIEFVPLTTKRIKVHKEDDFTSTSASSGIDTASWSNNNTPPICSTALNN